MIVKPLDIETSTSNYGNFADHNNVACFIGVGTNIHEIEYTDEPYGMALHEVQADIDESDLLLFVNAKFDLHWLTKYGIKFNHKRIWDCQLVDYMLSGQTESYPSMNSMAIKYNLPVKPDIKAKYWENGIDTRDIPRHEIVGYLQDHDLPTTLAIYEAQKVLVEAKGATFKRLVSLHNQDLLVLQEIEYNGLLFDEAACLRQADVEQVNINDLRASLYSSHSIPEFNTESGDHLSALLYGGTISIKRKELVGIYKTGERKGEDKYGWKEFLFYMPQLVKPKAGSELKKEGYWATGADVLKSLKPKGEAKKIVDTILELAKLEKIVSTYYLGLPALRAKMNWKQGKLHGNLNQCVARTGRLSSTKPNLQNISGDMKGVFGSRFK
jgi:DNA polymerase I-like protein with 3'-5' exonuclease and polymerase domains